MTYNLLAIIINKLNYMNIKHNQILCKFYQQIRIFTSMQKQNQEQTTQNIQHSQPVLLTSLSDTPSYHQVIDSLTNINSLIFSLNKKVENVIEKSQGEFLLAYQNHVRKINYELAQIKKKADQNQQENKQESKVVFLEKQVTIFRDEALKLYDRLQEKTHQAQVYKLKSKDLEKTCYITQKQIRQALKSKKTLQSKLKESQNKIIELEQELANKNEQLMKATALPSHSNTRAMSISNKKYSIREGSQKKKGIASTNKSLLYSHKQKRMSENNFSTLGYPDNQLKQWFIQCVKTIKKDVAHRKHSGYQYDLDQITSIQDFKMVDKLKLLQKFMENQKLLTWMYEKIFPSRSDQIKQYFSLKKLSSKNQYQQLDQETIKQSGLIEQFNINTELPPENNQINNKHEIILPKMRGHKSQVRNRVAVRDGKLSISNI